MMIKSRYTRAELEAAHCGQQMVAEKIHLADCPLADDTVMAVTLSVSPEPNVAICGRCSVAAQECSAYTRFGGWTLCTHARLMDICDRYKVATICRKCVKPCSDCPMTPWTGYTKSHAELMTECSWYRENATC